MGYNRVVEHAQMTKIQQLSRDTAIARRIERQIAELRERRLNARKPQQPTSLRDATFKAGPL